MLLAFLAALSLVSVSACSLSPWSDSGPGREYVDAGIRHEHKEWIDLGELLVVTIEPPAAGTHELAGASFDPTHLRLDMVKPDPDHPRATIYTFTTLALGQTIIEFRIQPVGGGDKETYKVVDLLIED